VTKTKRAAHDGPASAPLPTLPHPTAAIRISAATTRRQLPMMRSNISAATSRRSEIRALGRKPLPTAGAPRSRPVACRQSMRLAVAPQSQLCRHIGRVGDALSRAFLTPRLACFQATTPKSPKASVVRCERSPIAVFMEVISLSSRA
jgi:hypothetical protein